MSWKSDKKITREKAIEIIDRYIHTASEDKLEKALSNLGFGDDFDLPYYGHTLLITFGYDQEGSDDEIS